MGGAGSSYGAQAMNYCWWVGLGSAGSSSGTHRPLIAVGGWGRFILWCTGHELLLVGEAGRGQYNSPSGPQVMNIPLGQTQLPMMAQNWKPYETKAVHEKRYPHDSVVICMTLLMPL